MLSSQFILLINSFKIMFTLSKPWSDKFPTFTRPKIVGYFSVDATRSVILDASQLLYYFPVSKLREKSKFDLNRGIESVKLKPLDLNEGIDHVLHWIKRNSEKIRANSDSGKWIKPDFVIFRGQLTKIMKSIYDVKEGWILRAVKFRGTIYLCSYQTKEQKNAEIENMSAFQKLTMSWGYKFEQYLLTHDPNIPPVTSKPVNENEEFCCVFQSSLKDHRILYGAEMDGVNSTTKFSEPLPLDDLEFIELKTSKSVYNSRQQMTLEKHKFLRWWCQSFLVGVENLFCGFRNDEGIIENVQHFRISNLGRQHKHLWSAGKCMNVLDDFLSFVKSNVQETYDKTIYIFERRAYEDIRMTRVPANSEFAFLPSWYTQS